jgi:tRNA A-37 threonylcarbamoyl transferase component Bud32
MDAEYDILRSLHAGGFLRPGAPVALVRLAGGVSSDVFRLETAAGAVCVKRALAKLRVAADWRAPVQRSHYEVQWLRTARAFVGDCVPEVLYEDAAANLFVMSFFEPATHSVWKADLAAGRVDDGLAAQVGELLAKVHAGAAGSAEIAARFPTDALFEALRLGPFLRHAALAHADLSVKLVDMADRTAATRITLVHGDVSPKNILHGPEGPILLDAECAWYGDPAFDLAFCSAHLLLKTVWKPAYSADFLRAFAALRETYVAGISWEPPRRLDARAAALTAAILLARVDGKSPADYLQTDEARGFVRAQARRLLAADGLTLEGLAEDWKEGLRAR